MDRKSIERAVRISESMTPAINFLMRPGWLGMLIRLRFMAALLVRVVGSIMGLMFLTGLLVGGECGYMEYRC